MSALDGKCVVVTRPRDQAAPLCSELEARGATAMQLPTVAIRHGDATPELDAALHKLATYDWVIFTSSNTVDAVCARAAALEISPDAWTDTKPSIAAIGEATARALRERGMPVRAVAASASSEGIVSAVGNINFASVLLPQSDLARPELEHALKAHGATVHAVMAYRTVAQAPPKELLATALAAAHAIIFASPSAVAGFMQGLADAGAHHGTSCAIVSIGPVTSAALTRAGMTVDAEAHEASVAGIISALEAHFTQGGAMPA